MKRKLRKLADEVNGVIHRENLYVQTPGGNRRVIDCHVAPSGELVVRDLYSDTCYNVTSQNKFFNGYGTEQIFSIN